MHVIISMSLQRLRDLAKVVDGSGSPPDTNDRGCLRTIIPSPWRLDYDQPRDKLDDAAAELRGILNANNSAHDFTIYRGWMGNAVAKL